MGKAYLGIPSQRRYLQEIKHIDFIEEDGHCFLEKSYSELILPYLDMFALGRDELGKRIYPDSVPFEEYLECNRIDDEICYCLHMFIGCFERLGRWMLRQSQLWVQRPVK